MDHIVCISSRNLGQGHAWALGFNLCACMSLLWLLPTSFPRAGVLLDNPQRFPFPLACFHHLSPFSFQSCGWNSEPSTGKARALPLSYPIPPPPTCFLSTLRPLAPYYLSALVRLECWSREIPGQKSSQRCSLPSPHLERLLCFASAPNLRKCLLADLMGL